MLVTFIILMFLFLGWIAYEVLTSPEDPQEKWHQEACDFRKRDKHKD